jgi:hypothetical protein
MRKLVFSAFYAIVSIQLMAQPAMKVVKESHDFGTIEEGTQASFTFDIKNVGDQPLIINNVQPSCGCTTPEWTKEPIAPGSTGKIMATFNSQGRPGAFSKAVTVMNNTSEPTRVLTIKGFVGPKAENKNYTVDELTNSPIVSLDRKLFNFGKIESGQTIHQKIKLTNKGKTVMKFNGVQSGCYCVNYTIVKPEIAPGETAELELSYLPKGLGEQNDIVVLSTNDIVNTAPSISFQATVVKSFNNNSILNQGSSEVPFK